MMMRRTAAPDEHAEHPWWWDAVCYRVDVRSFADGDADGAGDLAGLRSRLGYLDLLGVDAIVLAGAPGLDPTSEEFTDLLTEAHDTGIRVMLAMDLDPERPDARAVIEGWLDHGIDGIHLDPRDDPSGTVAAVLADRPDALLVGSGSGTWQLEFNLDLAIADFAAESVRTAIIGVLDKLGDRRAAWAMASRDTGQVRTDSALTPVRAMALVQLALPGAVFLRHGEELGLPGSRRIIMPWEGEQPPFGFSAAEADWSAVPPQWAGSTVESQLEDPESTLSLYRQAMELRANHPAFHGEEVEWFGAPEGCFAFRRVGSSLICALNTSPDPVPIPPGELLLSSRPVDGGRLAPGTAAWLA